MIEASWESLNNDERINSPIDGVVDGFKSQSQPQQFNLIKRAVHSAARAIALHQPVLFLSYDDTPAGDVHCIKGVYEPRSNSFIIEIPEEPSDTRAANGQVYSRKGGRFPTVLHTIEMLVVAQQMAREIPFYSYDNPLKDTPFPTLKFINEDIQLAKLAGYGPPGILTISRIPLTYQPPTSNALFFNKTAEKKHINPIALANAHYDAMQKDQALVKEILRHTMLLEGTVPGGNRMVEITVLEADETKLYKLYRTVRIDSNWADPIKPPQLVGEIVDAKGRIIRRYSLKPGE